MKEIIIKPSELPVSKEVSNKRKALFKKYRAEFSVHMTNKEWFNAVMRFFVTGEESFSREIKENGDVVEKSLVDGLAKSMLHPSMSREYAQAKMRECSSYVSFGSATLIEIAMNYYGGVLEADDALVITNLLPQKYDHEQFIQESREKGYEARYMPSPIEIMDIFARHSEDFLTFHRPFSQYSRVQWMVDFWRQTLPFFNVEDFASPDGKKHYHLSFINKVGTLTRLRKLMRVVRFFVDPLYLAGTKSPIKRFRDKVLAIFEAGTGNAFIDHLWQESAHPAISLREERVRADMFMVFSDQALESLLAHIVAYTKNIGCTTQSFDAGNILLVDAKPFLQCMTAYLYGYLDEKKYKRKASRGDATSLAGVSVPAYVYRMPFNAILPQGINVPHHCELVFVCPMPHPSSASGATLPKCFVGVDWPWFTSEPNFFGGVLERAIRQWSMMLRRDVGVDIRFIQGCAHDTKLPHRMTPQHYGDLVAMETIVNAWAADIPYTTDLPLWKGALPTVNDPPK